MNPDHADQSTEEAMASGQSQSTPESEPGIPELLGFTEDAPDLLYHYTSMEGMLGIIDHEELWASDAGYMNDRSELEHGRLDLLEAVEVGLLDLDMEAAEQLRTVLSNFYDWYAVYAACFCEKGDLLSQWRSYGPDGGLALGFSSRELAAIRGPSPVAQVMHNEVTGTWDVIQFNEPGIYLAPVNYLDQDRRQAPVLMERNPHTPKMGGIGVATALAFQKHPGFREEQEWRLVWRAFREEATHKTRWRAGGVVGIVPFVSLALPRSALQEVVVGPGPHLEERARAIEQYLHKLEVDVPVRRSVLPLR